VTRESVSLWGAALTLLLGACTTRQLGETGVRIDVVADDPNLRPWYYELQWLDADRALLTRKVPEDGRLSEDPAATASVFIQLEPAAAGPRRVVARGWRDGAVVAVGSARVEAVGGQWKSVRVVTSAPEKVADRDGDEIPDDVDNCPTTRDPCPATDAAMDDGGSADGSGE
jgi:hypothetical protein